MTSIYSARKKLKNSEEFVLSLALSGKKESVLSASFRDLKATAFILKCILNGVITISPKLYSACKNKKLYKELEQLNFDNKLESTLLEDCKTGGSRSEFLRFLPIISLLLECLID